MGDPPRLIVLTKEETGAQGRRSSVVAGPGAVALVAGVAGVAMRRAVRRLVGSAAVFIAAVVALIVGEVVGLLGVAVVGGAHGRVRAVRVERRGELQLVADRIGREVEGVRHAQRDARGAGL